MLGVQTLLLALCTQLLPCRTGCEESTFPVSAALASLSDGMPLGAGLSLLSALSTAAGMGQGRGRGTEDGGAGEQLG